MEKKKYIEKGKGIKTRRLEQYSDEINGILQRHEQLEELTEYGPEIRNAITEYDTKSDKKTMMMKGLRKTDKKTTQRESHQKNATSVAIRISNGINKKQADSELPGLSTKIVATIMRHHDIGHTFLGHSGEWWLSNIGEDYGIGYYVHNALGPRELIYRDKINDEILEKIRQNHPEITDKKLKRIKNSLWMIMEGINSHNGETPQTEYTPNLSKTEKDFNEENLKCHTKKGFDKTLIPATPEACLARLCDKISYAPYDMVDGIREGFIKNLDERYISLLTQIGIDKEEIENCNQTGIYDEIARKVQEIWINDTIQNSSVTCIKMSQQQGDLQRKLIALNNEQIVDYVVLQEDNEVYPKCLRRLMNMFGNIILKENLIERLPKLFNNLEERETFIEKYKQTPFYEFIKYTCNSNAEDFEYTVQIIEEATKQGILDEQEKARQVILNNQEFQMSPDFKNRDARISGYIKYYRDRDISEYTEDEKQHDMEQILANIKDYRKRNHLYFSLQKRIALELGRKYLATLDDFEFIQLLVDTNLIDNSQYQSLTRRYADFDFKKEQYIQANWKEISKQQTQERT